MHYSGQSEGQLDVSLQVSWEPRLEPVYLQLPMDKMKVQLAEGSELNSSTGGDPEITSQSHSPSTQIDLQFQRPARSERKIKKLSGEFLSRLCPARNTNTFSKSLAMARGRANLW